MTTNQTIDGVPREPKWCEALLKLEVVREALTSSDSAERLKNLDAGKVLREGIAILKELRALLDTPAIKPRPFGYWLTPKTCAGLAMFQRELIEDPVLTASVVEYFHVTPLYDKPPAQPQGEPVEVVLLEFEPAFEKWWEEDGQYCRAGGGSYEKTFAYRAYEAALADVTRLNTK